MSRPRHKKQIEAFNDPARFKFLLAGRRGGKTHLITEDIVRAVHAAPEGAEIVYIGPTLQSAKELIWDSLDARLCDLGWRFLPFVSKSRFELSRGRKIYVLGAEKIRRVRGHKIAKAYLDEIAYFSTPLPEVWKALRPALADLKGGAIAATTPDGKGTQAYDFYLEAIGTPGWKCFQWTTRDNPYIDPAEIEAAKRELDARAFKQEFEAGWESFEGLAYYNFAEADHVYPQKVEPHLPINLCFDFNVNPTTLLLSQYQAGTMRFFKEYSIANSSTEETVHKFCTDFKPVKDAHVFRIKGDASGSARSSNTGRSDYEYVQEVLTYHGFKFHMDVPAANPPIIDRVKHVNGWLRPLQGSVRIAIDPSCKELIRDLGGQKLDGRHPSPENNRGHKADALGYCIWYEVLSSKRTPSRTIQL